MPLLEKEIETSLLEQGHIETEDGVVNWITNQFEIDGYYIDMLGISEDGKTLYVSELKKGEVDGNALSQLLNYIYLLNQYLKHHGTKITKIKGILIGEELSDYMQLAIKNFSSITFYNYTAKVSLKTSNWVIKAKSYDSKQIVESINNLNMMVEENTVIEQESDSKDE